MGKYMRKSKLAGDIAVMEVTQSTTSGVRTRAKTLALQRLQSPASADTTCYLQLRSRRLEKPPPPRSTTTSVRQGETKKGSLRSVKSSGCDKDRKTQGFCFGEKEEMLAWKCEAETSFGENCLDFEPRERNTRESTPCSMTRDVDTIQTPGSTTRRTCSDISNRRITNNRWRNIPTTHEMDEFFAYAERQQQRLFSEKYNFDVVNDVPLHGRYEWVRVSP